MRESKVSSHIKSYIIKRKRYNAALSCRVLASEVSKKYNIKFSKSTINNIFKAERLSQPIGRQVAAMFTSQGKVSVAGYVFLRGADILLGLSAIVAENLKRSGLFPRTTDQSLRALTEAWIFSKAVYNVTIEKITDYNKNDVWILIGKKMGKDALGQYVHAMKMLQPNMTQIVNELSAVLQDVICFKFSLSDGSCYFLDGQLKCIWRDPKIPINFCTTINIANNYINSIIQSTAPIVVFSGRPDMALSEEFANFIFSFDGSSSAKRLRRIELIDIQGNTLKEFSFVAPHRRRFIVGVWPWQYKPIAEFEKIRARGKINLEGSGKEFYFLEDAIKFSQHTENIEIMLRLVLLKSAQDAQADIAFFTNIDTDEMSAAEVAEYYLRRFPDPASEYALILDAIKSPPYFENFISAQKLLRELRRLNECVDADNFFALLVEILNLFSQRAFFGSCCSGWGLLKMRELIYKKTGLVKRDLASDVVFNIFINNELEENIFLKKASASFNDSPIFESSGRKIWVNLAPPSKIS